MPQFDPNAPADIDAGVFGLPSDPASASVLIIPAPFEATTSYRTGARLGPDAIIAASVQVDLYDTQFDAIYERGLCLAPAPDELDTLQRRADDNHAPAELNPVCAAAADAIEHRVTEVLRARATPITLGGEHAVSLGAIRACVHAAGSLGVLQIDAHMDLRDAYEGFTHSHASVMRNALETCPNLERLVQIGIRDICDEERAYAREQGDRVVTHCDIDWARRMDAGASFVELCRQSLEPLPSDIYLTVDIDGLDPSLCPDTGTPVPGGLSFDQFSLLIETLARSGKRVIGIDLVEVVPASGGRPAHEDWNAIVGARVLYKLCALAAPRGVSTRG